MTGLNGTLAPVFRMILEEKGIDVVGWDRALVSPSDSQQCLSFIESSGVDTVCHLAMGDAVWAENLAKICKLLDLQLLFTSTAMVFDSSLQGPYEISTPCNAVDDYGMGKVACEKVITQTNPDALICRIGWQIDWQAKGNNMLEALHKMQAQAGVIAASQKWIPATSFMQDTCECFIALLRLSANGIYHIDSNQHDALSFYDIVSRLKEMKEFKWNLNVDNSYAHDQRLNESRIEIPNISNRL